jgi:membrane-associated phospholipid phosphatase
MDWYPALAFPLLYKQVEFLAESIGNWGLTQIIQRWEIQIFNGHPSLWLGEAFPSVFLSEYLHFCYFSYILLLPAIGAYWYFRGDRNAFHDLLFLLAVTYYLSFLFFILYPVDSPYYLFTKLDAPAANGPVFKLVHFISGMGGARGGAFPSLHVSISTVILLTALRYKRRLFFFLVPVVGGIYAATLYGRFHYALDVIAGMALGTLVAVVFRCRRSPSQPDQAAQLGTEA